MAYLVAEICTSTHPLELIDYRLGSSGQQPAPNCRTWRTLKAAAGESPLCAASSPTSALEGASRTPLTVRSRICLVLGDEGFWGWV